MDFRKQQREHPPIHIDGTVVERVVFQEAEEIWLVTKSTHKLLQMHNREHPVGLYHRLVRQLLRQQP